MGFITQLAILPPQLPPSLEREWPRRTVAIDVPARVTADRGAAAAAPGAAATTTSTAAAEPTTVPAATASTAAAAATSAAAATIAAGAQPAADALAADAVCPRTPAVDKSTARRRPFAAATDSREYRSASNSDSCLAGPFDKFPPPSDFATDSQDPTDASTAGPLQSSRSIWAARAAAYHQNVGSRHQHVGTGERLDDTGARSRGY
jgi:hypothetical protein